MLMGKCLITSGDTCQSFSLDSGTGKCSLAGCSKNRLSFELCPF
jgi:hypothetical protein